MAPRNTLIKVATAAGALLVVGGVAAAFAFGAGLPRPATAYTLTKATTGSITQTWSTTGSISRTNQVDATFASTGKVTKVSVQPGDAVAAGQVLATLDAGPLELDVLLAEAARTQAQAQLEIDKAALSASAGSASSGTGSSTASALAQLTALQAQLKVLSAQLAAANTQSAKSKAAAAAAAAAQAKLLAAITAALAGPACVATFADAALGPKPTPSPTATDSPTALPSGTPAQTPTASATQTATPTATPTSQPTATPTASPTAEASPSPTGLTTPTAPQQATPAQVAQCQAALLTALGAGGPSGGATPSPTPQPSLSPKPTVQQTTSRPAAGSTQQSTASTNAASGGQVGGSASAGQSTAAKVAADEANLLQAQQQLATAKASLAAATLKAPIAGRVGAVTLVAGQASGSKGVTVIGEGAAVVTVSVPLSVRPLITNGQQATITVPGSSATVTGSVSRISLLSDAASTSGNPTYATEITAADAQGLLFSGGVAGVTVELGSIDNVTVVPGSVVTPTGVGTGTLQVPGADASAAARTVSVTTGATGQGLVQIVSGVGAGEAVVLADLNATVPANSFQRSGSRTATTEVATPGSAPTAVAVPSATPSR